MPNILTDDDLLSFTRRASITQRRAYANSKEAIKALTNDFGLFLSYCLSRKNMAVSKLQLARAKFLTSGHNSVLLNTFRGSSKSTDIGYYCLWRWLRNPNTRILVLSAKEENAARHVRRCMQLASACALTKQYQYSKRTATGFNLKHARAEETMSLNTAGIYSAIEGLRADVIILDDVEVLSLSETPHQRAKLLNRLSEVQAILHPFRYGIPLIPEETSSIIIGTPQSMDSIYFAQNENSPLHGVSSFIVPALINNHSTMPERFTTEQMFIKKSKMSTPQWALQMMMSPSLVDAGKRVLNVDNFKVTDGLSHSRIMTVDPCGDAALGRKGDEAAIAIVGVHTAEHNSLIVEHLSGHRLNANDFSDLVLSLADKYGVDTIKIESNVNIWYSYLTRAAELKGCKVHIEAIKSTQNKHSRLIETLEPWINGGQIYFKQEVLSDENNMRQFRNFTFASNTLDYDDRLDALSMGINSFTDYLRSNHTFKLGTKADIVMSEEDVASGGWNSY